MTKILIADFDYDCRAKIREAAQKKHWQHDEAENGVNALKLFRRNEYDLVILEYGIPELNGIIVCQQIRKLSDVPIIFLSSKSKEYYKLEAFDAGVDDYIIKPFYISELIARVAVHLKRSGTANRNSVLRSSGIVLNIDSHEVRTDNKRISLSPREYALLACLMQNQGIVLSRSRLLDEVWGEDYSGTDRTVDTHIKSLRERLGQPYSSCIVTVWGIGYKFFPYELI